MSHTNCNAIDKQSLSQLHSMPIDKVLTWLATKQPWMQQHIIKELASIH